MIDAISVVREHDGTPCVDFTIRQDCVLTIAVTEDALSWAWVDGEMSVHGVTRDLNLSKKLNYMLNKIIKEQEEPVRQKEIQALSAALEVVERVAKSNAEIKK